MRKFNSKANSQITFLKTSNKGELLYYAGEDNLLRICPTFGVGADCKFKPTNFELSGHKSRILDVLDELDTIGYMSSIDSNGRLLVWKLVERDEIKQSQMKRVKPSSENPEAMIKALNEDNEFNVSFETNLTELEKKMITHKFILYSKHSVFKEKQRLTVAQFHG